MTTDASPPPVFGRPTDAPPPLTPIVDSPAWHALREARAALSGGRAFSLRAWAARVTGRADRRLLHAVAEAAEAMAARCDLLAERLGAQEAVTAEVAGGLGAELTRLRAGVLALGQAAPGQAAPGQADPEPSGPASGE